MTMIAVAASGYGIVGVLFTILTALLLTTWRGHRPGVYLILASLINALWGFLLAWSIAISPVDALTIFVVEVSRAASWIFFLTFLAARIGLHRIVRVAALGICAAVFFAGGLAWVNRRWFEGSGDVGQVLFHGGLIIALTGLLLIEQLYRNSPVEARWGLKALVLGVGGIFAYDLFLYSQAVLFGAIDEATWVARGFINALFVPGIAIAARRNPDWRLRIFVSRQVVFYTTTLIAVGAYLLLMSLGGYLLIYFGGSWGALGRAVFFAGAILVLLILLFSSTIRARLRVFLAKHFYQNKYEYRDEWMRLVSTLAEFEKSSTREVVVRAIAQIVNSPGGALWIHSQREGKFLLDARYNYDGVLPDLDTNDTLIAFMRRDHWVVDIAEYERDQERYSDLVLPPWTRRLSSPWLFIPIMFGHELLGLVLLQRAVGPPRLNYEDRDLLKTVGNHVAVHLAQARSDRLLTEAQQFDAYNKLTAFLMHDLNNLIAQQSLIVENAEKHKRNPEFVDDAISTISGSVERMKSVMAQLRRGQGRPASKLIEIRFLVSAAVDRCSNRMPKPELVLNDDNAVVKAEPEDFTMVLTHLIRNAQDATASEGCVQVKLESDEENARVAIRDSGSGMTPEFVRERLFRPFESTKGSEGMGIGAYQAREFARSCGGDVLVVSTPGEGTEMTLIVPRVRAAT